MMKLRDKMQRYPKATRPIDLGWSTGGIRRQEQKEETMRLATDTITQQILDGLGLRPGERVRLVDSYAPPDRVVVKAEAGRARIAFYRQLEAREEAERDRLTRQARAAKGYDYYRRIP